MREHLAELAREFLSGGVGGFVAYWIHHSHHRIFRQLFKLRHLR